MAGRYRTTKEKSRSRFYFLLSVIFVIVMIKWGVPYFMDLVAGKGVQRQNQDSDIIPPQPPILAALPEATNSSSLTVEGFTESLAALDLLVNDSIQAVDKANEDGSFSVKAQLNSGNNRIQIRASDEAGNMSESEVKVVNYDNKETELNLQTPKDGEEFFGKNANVIEVKGVVNKPDVSVVVNNSFVTADSEGAFSYRLQLSDGKNEIKVVASDRAGNTSEKTISVTYFP